MSRHLLSMKSQRAASALPLERRPAGQAQARSQLSNGGTFHVNLPTLKMDPIPIVDPIAMVELIPIVYPIHKVDIQTHEYNPIIH